MAGFGQSLKREHAGLEGLLIGWCAKGHAQPFLPPQRSTLVTQTRPSTWRLRALVCESWALRRRTMASPHHPHRVMEQALRGALRLGPQAAPSMPRPHRALLREHWAGASAQTLHRALPRRPQDGLSGRMTAFVQRQELRGPRSAAQGDMPACPGCRGGR